MSSVDESHIADVLSKTDWDKYWQDVSNAVAKEVDAYAEARRRSLAIASTFVMD